ncbi:MAG: ceramidase domain-containing protein [Planctomycetota bacterium]
MILAYADQRSWLGIPNAWDVLSNLPFLVVGVFGMWAMRRREGTCPIPAWPDRWAFIALFSGTASVAFGSAAYHLAPSRDRLVWDRLPMSIAFAALLTLAISERFSRRWAQTLFIPLLLLGPATVLFWAATGEIRPYGALQYGSLLVIAASLVLFPRRAPGTTYWVLGLACYALAKLLETVDTEVFRATEYVSGHTLKHIASAMGVWCLAMLVRRRCRPATLTT